VNRELRSLGSGSSWVIEGSQHLGTSGGSFLSSSTILGCGSHASKRKRASAPPRRAAALAATHQLSIQPTANGIQGKPCDTTGEEGRSTGFANAPDRSYRQAALFESGPAAVFNIRLKKPNPVKPGPVGGRPTCFGSKGPLKKNRSAAFSGIAIFWPVL
jgi:hypothetical protein